MQRRAVLRSASIDGPNRGCVAHAAAGVRYYSLDISIRYIEARTNIRSTTHGRAPVLELAILGLLQEQPLHGYELKKRLSETLGSFWGVSFGSLYPALRRLERSGRHRGRRRPGRREPGHRPGDPAHRLAQGRSRGRPPPARARPRRSPHPQGLPDHPVRPGAVLRAPHRRRRRRRRAPLLAEARVLSLPRPRGPPRRSSSAGAPSSPTVSTQARRTPRPRRSTATPAPSWSTAPDPPSATSSGSTN